MSRVEKNSRKPLERSAVSRRNVVKGAAWGVPAVLITAAAPLAAASVTGATVAFDGNAAQLLKLGLLDGGLLSASVFGVTGPRNIVVNNTATAGPINGDIQLTVTIEPDRNTLLAISLGTIKGYGVHSVNGVTVPSGSVESFQIYSVGILPLAKSFKVTQTFTIPGPFAPGSTQLPVVFGLTAGGSLLSASLLLGFNVTMSASQGGTSLGVSSGRISGLVSAGVLS